MIAAGPQGNIVQAMLYVTNISSCVLIMLLYSSVFFILVYFLFVCSYVGPLDPLVVQCMKKMRRDS